MSHFKNTEPTLLDKMGSFSSENVRSSATFSLDRDSWCEHLADGCQPEGTRLAKERDYDAGLYTFWWKGPESEMPKSNIHHFIKGKWVTELDLSRIEGTGTRIVDTGKTTKKGARIYHLYHPVTWVFKKLSINGSTYIPLYIGKATHIFNRLTGHLRWPGSNKCPYRNAEEVIKDINGDSLSIVRAPKNDTQTQFRRCFEYMFKDEPYDDIQRREILKKHIAISIWTNPFAEFEDRFYGEDYLIGSLKPPFNLDSER